MKKMYFPLMGVTRFAKPGKFINGATEHHTNGFNTPEEARQYQKDFKNKYPDGKRFDEGDYFSIVYAKDQVIELYCDD